MHNKYIYIYIYMVLDTSLLNTQQYKICIKGKVEQSSERNSAFPYTSEKRVFRSLSTMFTNFTYICDS